MVSPDFPRSWRGVVHSIESVSVDLRLDEAGKVRACLLLYLIVSLFVFAILFKE